ncbi:MAG: rod shape-determining protein MreD [Kordiimonadaceae bacterium]|jgi:rod shape-determining protein MreD|nr:rod shape-determining protein MreD [Kordiimonadaceae bacterium]MBT6030950.1 rod shape-determining protein MreD [Kordiimonadaceae bacterium]
MNISSQQEKSLGFKAVLPFLTLVVLIVLMVLPYNISILSDTMPYLTLIGVYYWCVFKPDLLPVAAVFVLGLIQDVLLGSPFGLMPLMLIGVHQFVYMQGRQFLERDFIFNWVIFIMLVVGYGVVYWAITSLYYRELLDYLSIIGQILVTIAFYPIITGILGLVRRAF